MDSCCHNCFQDTHLKRVIKEDGRSGVCALCGEKGAKCLVVSELRSLFEPIVALYTQVESYMGLEDLKEGGHETLADRLTDDWEIFDTVEVARKFLSLCAEPFDPNHNPDGDPFEPDRAVGEVDLYVDVDYAESSQLKTLWDDLRDELRTTNRFFAGREILDRLVRAVKPAAVTLPSGTIMLRARAGSNGDRPYRRTEMGAPPPSRATAGRANPFRIPYLYLASSEATAVAELRPHVGDVVSIGNFRTKTPVKVIDFRDPRIASPFLHGDQLGSVVQVLGFLRVLSDDLSRPLSDTERELGYLPTQYLCEFLKTQGYGGVLYKSGLAKGFNLALFDVGAARCTKVRRVQIKAIKIEF